METMTVNGRELTVIRLLGKGKGGYSYLVTDGKTEYVLKQIHHEPCDYYTFGDKIASELNDYRTLRETGIRMPAMIDIDTENERVLKEYIGGETADRIAADGRMTEAYIGQVRDMCRALYPRGLNIDYYPTNFVARDGLLYYIDYECNRYSDEWNFENWGLQYWKNPGAPAGG